MHAAAVIAFVLQLAGHIGRLLVAHVPIYEMNAPVAGCLRLPYVVIFPHKVVFHPSVEAA